MADLPIEGRVTEVVEKKEAPLSVEERLALMNKDILEIARGVNTQGALLESIIVAFDHVVKKYLSLTRISNEPVAVAKPSEEKSETK